MKAWIGYSKNGSKDGSLCIYAETRGKARAIAASMMSISFIEALVLRFTNCDRYYEN